MYEEPTLKILLGNSIPLPEEDLDDEYVKSEYGKPNEEEALREFYFTTITGSINQEDFKENYLSVIDSIKKEYDSEKQKMLCIAILHSIEEKYDYEPLENVELNTDDDIIDVLKFLEFLEYDHEEFILDVWGFLKPETNSFQVENYCEQNKDKIISEIEEQLDTKSYPKLIADFLRTYKKDDMIQWFCNRSNRLNTAILLRIREE